MDPPGWRQRHAAGCSYDGGRLTFDHDGVIDTQRVLTRRAKHVNDHGVTHGSTYDDIPDVTASDDVDSAGDDRTPHGDITDLTASDDDAPAIDDGTAGDYATRHYGACPGRTSAAAHGACACGDACRASPGRPNLDRPDAYAHA